MASVRTSPLFSPGKKNNKGIPRKLSLMTTCQVFHLHWSVYLLSQQPRAGSHQTRKEEEEEDEDESEEDVDEDDEDTDDEN